MNTRTLCATAALVFLVSGVSHAAELSTAPMYTSSSNQLYCSIVNISSASQTVRVRFYDQNGTITSDTGNVVLPARVARVFGGFGASGHCRFTTVNAKTLFRAAIFVWDYPAAIQNASLPAQ